MEINHKQQNRDKWKASTRRGRGSGKGVPGGQPDEAEALESNHHRFQDSEDEGHSVLPDLPTKQSKGSDFEQLLAEAQPFYAQARHRYRSFIEAVDLEPPAVDVAALEQELVIDPDLLIRSLLPLPLPELLSVSVPQIFLSEGSWDDPPKVVIPQQTSCNTQGVLSTSQSHSGADTYHQHQQQSQKSFVAQARGQQEHITKQHNEASHAVLPPQLRASQPCTNTIPAAADTSAQPHTSAVQPAAPSIRPQTAQLIFTSRQVDDTDELLDLLLLGRDTPQPSSQTSAAAVRVEASAAQTVHSRAGATTASPHTTRLAAQTSSASEPVSSKDIPQGRTSGQSICVQQVQAPPPAAAAATHRPPMAPKPVSAVIDDELQALLGLDVSSGPAACGSRGQVQSTPAAATSKGSLEDWLDKF